MTLDNRAWSRLDYYCLPLGGRFIVVKYVVRGNGIFRCTSTKLPCKFRKMDVCKPVCLAYNFGISFTEQV